MRQLSSRDEKTLRFARAEVRRVLRALSLADLTKHVHFDLVSTPGRGPRRALKGDGFAILPEAGEFRIASRHPRGLVYGAYALLETLGCRWHFPGPGGECLPARPAALPTDMILENPETPYRSMVAFWDRTGPGRPARIKENLDFAVRARYNRFYLHWPTGLSAAARLAREQGHGLDIGIKLHTARELLPAALFPAHPEWFRMQEGRRTPKYNLCVSSRPGLAEVSRNARVLAESVPVDITDLAYWQDDVPNAWCQCPSCAGLSPSEQNLRLMRAILKGAREAHPGARLSFLAYYATVAPPESPIPSGLFLEHAPHAACYRHHIDDPTCPKNAALTRQLRRNLTRFSPATARVFEYWLDAALFSFYRRPVRRLPLMPARMSHDVDFYRGVGLSEIENVQWMLPREAVGSPEASHPGYALLPRLLWNPRLDMAGFLADFARSFYGTDRATAVLDLVAGADAANPRYVCEATDRSGGARAAAGLLRQAVARCRQLEKDAEGRHRERLAGLGVALQYDLARAEAGEA